jgi:2'-hydroxyisoflavone reductase
LNILIIGGTVFLGRYVTESAKGRGHQVTLFNRSRNAPLPQAGVENLRGDRRGDLRELRGRRWDAVVDTCGYVPSVVRSSVAALRDAVRRYVFISSISVYSESESKEVDETTPVNQVSTEQVDWAEKVEPEDPITAVNYGRAYGGLKALCEREVERGMPGRAVHVRAGLIVGPYDYSDRFTYWPTRIARGGEVLAPGEPDRPKQLIDVRDVSDWIIRVLETGEAGTYNVTGPDYRLTMLGLLEECRAATAGDAELVWVSDQFLEESNVGPWREMPLWIPRRYEMPAFQAVNNSKAVAAGLKFRPLAETIIDTLAWDSERPTELERRAGLDPAKELRILKAWHERNRQG